MLDQLGARAARRPEPPARLQLRVRGRAAGAGVLRPRRRGRCDGAGSPQLAGTLTGEHEEEALIVVQQAVEAINTGTAAQARELADGHGSTAGLPSSPAR